MSGFMSVDHHADFAGWAEKDSETGTAVQRWSGIVQALCFLGLCALSWLVVVSPFLLLG